MEINLRIPSLRVRREGQESPDTIVNSEIRFNKHVELAAIPKPGDVLQMAVGSDRMFDCEVVRSHWDQEKDMFVIACRYSKRSIAVDEYQALMSSSDWQVKTLL